MKIFQILLRYALLWLILLTLYFPMPSRAAYPVLHDYIITYNQKDLEQSLNDDTYQGEVGILRIRPDIASDLGMKIFMDQDYLDSRILFKKSEAALKKVEALLKSEDKELSSEYYAKNILESYLIYKNNLELIRTKLAVYRTKIAPENDERMNDVVSTNLMARLLEESFKRQDYRLRDALGDFYNVCHGVIDAVFPVTKENVKFVNHVYNGFIQHSSREIMKAFNLDHDVGYKVDFKTSNWKRVAENEMPKLVSNLETVFKRLEGKIYNVDPLLFIALLKKESSFNPKAVSSVGAAGLAQFMPKTAQGMGMKNIYMPDYFNEAGSFLARERRVRREAFAILEQIDEENGLENSARAREKMQIALALRKEGINLFSRYKKELQGDYSDDRLQPDLSIEYGIKYFSSLMKSQKGDISLALASYNAGQSRVRDYKGIPPYEETVGYRNKVLMFYREYIAMLKAE